MNGESAIKQIVDGGYCIGCGGCAAFGGDRVSMELDPYGMFKPVFKAELADDEVARILNGCPFSDEGSNENVIGEELFSDHCTFNPDLGYYKDLYVGHVVEGDFRQKGTSGGVITWVLAKLLESGQVDAVVHVKTSVERENGLLFQYGVSSSVEEVKAGAKSRYYPVEASQVLRRIKEVPGRYAVVGLPCFIKAVRKFSEQDPILKERVSFCVGVVCGHLKSKAFADCFAWQAGILPGELTDIDFRVKLSHRSAGAYGVSVRSADKEDLRPTTDYFGSIWGHNFFRYSACDYCDDVFGETADISVGDAWLPGYESDSAGNSVIVLRHPEIVKLFTAERTAGNLKMDQADHELIIQSQAGGLRDRREGLAYRLHLKKCDGAWAPAKRVEPSCGMPRSRRKIYNYRLELRELSHSAWQRAIATNDFMLFKNSMQPLLNRLDRCYRSPLRRLAGRGKRLICSLLKSFSNK